ncbi:hypothetical protein E1B28_006700 [Marasmius oreades]|uniref:Uncharacterized protein n=1 Tax=Marasmius oreades TaxID=181124 RepID=A0A9P7UWM7_9AGAR|nr:uncharacterized protein E1B28_006700 [Marasmius oreades]KAG7096017.1 hypothetical protein E1B28_006700 [Marasmius oreades]
MPKSGIVSATAPKLKSLPLYHHHTHNIRINFKFHIQIAGNDLPSLTDSAVCSLLPSLHHSFQTLHIHLTVSSHFSCIRYGALTIETFDITGFAAIIINRF